MSANVSVCPEVFGKLPFEDGPGFEVERQWLENNVSIPVVSTITYLALIYYGQKWMSDRKPFELKWLLFAWNMSLAIFSLLGTVRLAEDMAHILTYYDFNSTICMTGPCKLRGFWIRVFALSKLVELGDTALIVLRKRPLIFLHVYHHISVLFFTWMATAEGASFGRYFMAVNFMVHSCMYFYFAMCTIGIRPSKWVSMTITSLQIIQMVAGIFVVYYANDQLSRGNHCDVRPSTIRNALLMYASYFVLFVNFFIQAYIKPKGSRIKAKHLVDCNGNYDKTIKKGL